MASDDSQRSTRWAITSPRALAALSVGFAVLALVSLLGVLLGPADVPHILSTCGWTAGAVAFGASWLAARRRQP